MTQVRRYELTEEQFALVSDLLPRNGRRGGQWNDHPDVLNGIFWILHTGAQWRELPERYGNWKSVDDRFRSWQRDGTLDRILERLQMRLDADGRIEFDLWFVDATPIRASRSAGGWEKTCPPLSRRTMLWAVPVADLEQNCIW